MVACALTLLLGLGCALARAAEPPLAAALCSVVSVLPQWPANRTRLDEPEGSGVVVGRHGVVITALHVVNSALSIRVRTNQGRLLPARLRARDKATDVALLDVAGLEAAPLVFSTEPEIGAPVCAIGNAFGLGVSVSCGVVSATRRAGIGFNSVEDFLQTDAAVNPGASGGALVATPTAV